MSISDEEQAQIDEFEGRVFVDRVSVNDKTLLHSFDLHFPTNGVTAILGPSGAGKTTLLQMVIDAVPSGVTAKGIVRMPGSTAFVPQEDQLHGFYTCRSYLHHYARLCGIPLSAATPRVEELLKQLGLLEQADNGTIVGDVFLKGLSGGQRRRLSVALECVSHPTQLVLDEPTSGLDAESALKMMEFLKSYARAGKGRRVVLTIHQPSSFLWQTIDHVILLSKGKLMYEGSREHMESFFESSGYPTPSGWNPADHYVVRGKLPSFICPRAMKTHNYLVLHFFGVTNRLLSMMSFRSISSASMNGLSCLQTGSQTIKPPTASRHPEPKASSKLPSSMSLRPFEPQILWKWLWS